MKFTDIDFGQLLAILEENDQAFVDVDDYQLLSYNEEAGTATYKLIFRDEIDWIVKLRRMDGVFVVTDC